MIIRGLSGSCRLSISTGQPVHTNKIGINQIALILHLTCEDEPDAALDAALDVVLGEALALAAGVGDVAAPLHAQHAGSNSGRIRHRTRPDTDNMGMDNTKGMHCNSITHRHKRTDTQRP